MDAEGFEYQSGILSLLVDLYTHHEKLPEAMEMYQKVYEQDPNAVIDEMKLLRFVNLLIKNDKSEGKKS